MTYKNIQYDLADQVAVIGLNRPPVNALSLGVVDEIIAALRRAGEDNKVRVIIIKSKLETNFCAGLELSEVRGVDGQGMRDFLSKLYFELNDVQYRLGKPSIAVVEGAARAGGMTIAVSCNMVIAGENASFGYPEINVGLIPALHFVHLPRVAGRHRASARSIVSAVGRVVTKIIRSLSSSNVSSCTDPYSSGDVNPVALRASLI